MNRVILESPYAGDVERNTRYARRAMLDCLRRGESPMVSHLLYTQVLDDLKPEERNRGIMAGHSWISAVTKVVVYNDYGTSPGMVVGIVRARALGIEVEIREIGPNEND